ncbi:MAG TPA: tripartite tricarboxylate transporter substrate binding protein [Xanthobacteraceae bacterium]|jgi:tripartite-type tricarboxylate transporter receptor subunit TctC|nr:tripartite tricarboxylate transporter substrate binding protein [Xanthobacteraceae bacterium]
MSFRSHSFLHAATGAALALILAPAAARAEFPEKPVEMTVLFGGSAQTTAQVLADLMSKKLGEPVVAVSRPGGGGAIGYTYVKNTAADGYNIVWNSNSISTVHYQGNLPFDYKAFTPIARVSLEVPAVAVNASSGWKTLHDMVEGTKKSGKRLKVGISGFGSFTHLTSAALFKRLGLQVIYVPYGEGRAPAELLGNRIDVAVQWPNQFVGEAKAGKLNILCVTSAKRIPLLPETPACDEAGAKGLDITMWRGLAAPSGTPPAVVKKLQEAAKEAVASPEFQKAGQNLGFTPAFLPANEFGKVVQKDDAEISKLMTDLNLKKK